MIVLFLPTYLVWSDVPVLVGQESVLEQVGVLEEVPLVPGPPQEVLDPLALPVRVPPLAKAHGVTIVLCWISRYFAELLYASRN